ncbi:MAG: HTTM domain-containing protein [Gemmataceae bacterium]
MMALIARLLWLVRSLWLDLLSRLQAAWDGWRWFWFTPADPLMLGVLRIGTGFVLLWVLSATGPLLPVLYGPDAWVDQKTANLIRHESPLLPPLPSWDPIGPDERQGIVYQPHLNQGPEVLPYAARWGMWPGYAYSRGLAQFSPFFHTESILEMGIVHGLSMIAVFLFAIGLWTRLTSVLAWVVALSYIHRVSSALFGMDTMMALLLLYLSISPSGTALSLDNWLLNRRRRLLGLEPLGVQSSVLAGLGLRLIQVHFAFIYLASGLSKLQGPSWWNGTALWQTLSNYEFTPERFPGYTAFLRLLTESRPVWEIFHSGGALFTLLLESSFLFLVWYRGWRVILILGAYLLHTGISLSMGLHSFSFLMILMASSFVNPAWLRSCLAWWLRRREPRAEPLPAPSLPTRASPEVAVRPS